MPTPYVIATLPDAIGRAGRGSSPKAIRPAVMTSIGSIMNVLPASFAFATVPSRSLGSQVDQTLGKVALGLGHDGGRQAGHSACTRRSHRHPEDRPGMSQPNRSGVESLGGGRVGDHRVDPAGVPLGQLIAGGHSAPRSVVVTRRFGGVAGWVIRPTWSVPPSSRQPPPPSTHFHRLGPCPHSPDRTRDTSSRFLALLQEMLDAGEETNTAQDLTDPVVFAAFTQRLHDLSVPETPRAEGISLGTTPWWVDGEEYLDGFRSGMSSPRPADASSGDTSATWCGPPPADRAHASAMLAAALPIARGLGIDPALLTCDADNAGSRRHRVQWWDLRGPARGQAAVLGPHQRRRDLGSLPGLDPGRPRQLVRVRPGHGPLRLAPVERVDDDREQQHGTGDHVANRGVQAQQAQAAGDRLDHRG